jgi:type IV secretory pathway TraG/TraD family ATPase VirD4
MSIHQLIELFINRFWYGITHPPSLWVIIGYALLCIPIILIARASKSSYVRTILLILTILCYILALSPTMRYGFYLYLKALSKVSLSLHILFSFGFLAVSFIYIKNHTIPPVIRWIEDFLKIDKEKKKREELNIESDITIKEFSLIEKLQEYENTTQYFIGIDDEDNDIVISENDLPKHIHSLGPSGTGKTQFAIIPFIIQSIRKKHGACIIDFKGDTVAIHLAEQSAKSRGKKFYYFTLEPDQNSNTYNPFKNGDALSIVDRIMTCLELQSTGDAKFYNDLQRMVLISLIPSLTKKKILFTANDLREILRSKEKFDFLFQNEKGSSQFEFKPDHMIGLYSALVPYATTKVINDPYPDIDLKEIMENRDVVYFNLKSNLNPQLSEGIGKMIAMDLQYCSAFRNELNDLFFLLIDEFQNMACESFTNIIAKVRSANLVCVLANQALGDLKAVDGTGAFENTILTNTATKIIFQVRKSIDAKEFANATGTTQYWQQGISQFSGAGNDGESTALDGHRSMQGRVEKVDKPYISENVFLKLPLGKSVVFANNLKKNLPAVICNHTFLINKKKNDELLKTPIPVKEYPENKDTETKPFNEYWNDKDKPEVKSQEREKSKERRKGDGDKGRQGEKEMGRKGEDEKTGKQENKKTEIGNLSSVIGENTGKQEREQGNRETETGSKNQVSNDKNQAKPETCDIQPATPKPNKKQVYPSKRQKEMIREYAEKKNVSNEELLELCKKHNGTIDEKRIKETNIKYPFVSGLILPDFESSEKIINYLKEL